MIEIQLNSYAKARFWYGKFPIIGESDSYTISKCFQSNASSITVERLAGIELYIPSGAKTNYALVCGKFVPQESNKLIINVLVSTSFGNLINWALGSTVDEVRSGLPKEFSDSIFLGASEAPEKLGGGILSFGPFAYGIVSSSSKMFNITSKALIDILHAEPQSLSAEVLSQLLFRTIHEFNIQIE